jgi:3-deoxy-D-manno-octulosonic-acid transferase
MWLLFPFWILYSWRRCKKQDTPSLCWKQLWTLHCPTLAKGAVWIHAVSLGETQAALILIRALRWEHPDLPIFFTGGNSSAVNLATKNAVSNMQVSFLPLDYALLRRHLFKVLQPRLLILMETELWPNLLRTAHQNTVPVAIIQARLSKSSKQTYPKYGQPLVSQLLAPVALVAAQTQADADCLIALGIASERCRLLGNIKYDFTPPKQDNYATDTPHSTDSHHHYDDLANRIGNRWIWVAGSTHPNEEVPLLEAHAQLTQKDSHSLLILVPRHPSYFKELAQKLTDANLPFERWMQWFTSGRPLSPSTQILLIDTLGELMTAYTLADACFVGGSLVPWGGHNMLEPAALAKPILAGSHNHNFADIEQGLLNTQALLIVNNANELATQLIHLHNNPQQAQLLGQRAQTYFYSQQGATERVLAALSPYLNNPAITLPVTHLSG